MRPHRRFLFSRANWDHSRNFELWMAVLFFFTVGRFHGVLTCFSLMAFYASSAIKRPIRCSTAPIHACWAACFRATIPALKEGLKLPIAQKQPAHIPADDLLITAAAFPCLQLYNHTHLIRLPVIAHNRIMGVFFWQLAENTKSFIL